MFALCDNITVLRNGRHIITETVAATNPHRGVTQMIGRELLILRPAHLTREPGPCRFSVRSISSGQRFRNINLEARAG
jgi:ABC-type sugar transport system ATPase subunit